MFVFHTPDPGLISGTTYDLSSTARNALSVPHIPPQKKSKDSPLDNFRTLVDARWIVWVAYQLELQFLVRARLLMGHWFDHSAFSPNPLASANWKKRVEFALRHRVQSAWVQSRPKCGAFQNASWKAAWLVSMANSSEGFSGSPRQEELREQVLGQGMCGCLGKMNFRKQRKN